MSLLKDALYTHLSGHAGLSALIGTRIYPVRVPDTATYPLLTYQTVSNVRQEAHGGLTGHASPRLQLTVWGETYDSAKAVAEQVRMAMVGFSGTVDGISIDGASPAGEIDLPPAEPEIYPVVLDYRVWFTEAVA